MAKLIKRNASKINTIKVLASKNGHAVEFQQDRYDNSIWYIWNDDTQWLDMWLQALSPVAFNLIATKLGYSSARLTTMDNCSTYAIIVK